MTKLSRTFFYLRAKYITEGCNKESFVAWLVTVKYSKDQIAEIGAMLRKAAEGEQVDHGKIFEVNI